MEILFLINEQDLKNKQIKNAVDVITSIKSPTYIRPAKAKYAKSAKRLVEYKRSEPRKKLLRDCLAKAYPNYLNSTQISNYLSSRERGCTKLKARSWFHNYKKSVDFIERQNQGYRLDSQYV